MPDSAVLDTNVLLLWLAGRVDSSLFITWKRVTVFEVDDFQALERLLGPFKSVVTTPHVLTETSNFLDQAPLYRRLELIHELQRFITYNQELYEAANMLSERDDFKLLGLADTGLVSLSEHRVVVTTDFHLSGRILHAGGHTLNFNHFRAKRLLH